MWQLWAVPAPSRKRLSSGSQATSPAAATTGSASDAGLGSAAEVTMDGGSPGLRASVAAATATPTTTAGHLRRGLVPRQASGRADPSCPFAHRDPGPPG
jgi:hypothetical protein